MLTRPASYPIFAASFASNKPGCLVVGGGGGGGRHGVKNKITLFDFSSRAPKIEPSAEIVASEDDSVTCLANLATKDGLILYAGINGSEEDRLKDRNNHFQAFQVMLPKGSEGAISYLSKTALFAPVQSVAAKKEGYQRLVRLSPPARTAQVAPIKRIGAVASSLAGDENEIVVFSATSNKPQNPGDIIQRIPLTKGQEANDLDIVDRGDGHFHVAYVLDHDVYVQEVNYDFGKKKSKGTDERRKLYTIPHADAMQKKPRSKLRCIRWLTPEHLLLLVNKPNRTGVDMLVLHMYEEGPGSIIRRKTLPKRVKAATDMDVALLDADSEGAYQIAVCVAAIDISLSVYTIDYNGRTRNSLGSFHPFATYDNVSFDHSKREVAAN
jgi:prolactin regulatory element-binding protein